MLSYVLGILNAAEHGPKQCRQDQGSALQQLEQACQAWAPEDRGASKDLIDWQHQLRSLVQAGIPMVSGLFACLQTGESLCTHRQAASCCGLLDKAVGMRASYD